MGDLVEGDVHRLGGLGRVGPYAFRWAYRIAYRDLLLARVGWPARLPRVGGAMVVIVLFGGAGEGFYDCQF